VLHSLACAVVLGHLVAVSTCGSLAEGPEKSGTTATPFEAQGWSEAGRRATARHAWACSDQTPAQLSQARRGGVHAGGARPPEWVRRCSYTRLLCQQIHRGAQATDEERDECSAYESIHGRVSAR